MVADSSTCSERRTKVLACHVFAIASSARAPQMRSPALSHSWNPHVRRVSVASGEPGDRRGGLPALSESYPARASQGGSRWRRTWS